MIEEETEGDRSQERGLTPDGVVLGGVVSAIAGSTETTALPPHTGACGLSEALVKCIISKCSAGDSVLLLPLLEGNPVAPGGVERS